MMHNTAGSEPVVLRGIDSARATASPMPGANGRGPVRELGRFYEMLLGRGTRDGVQMLTPQTVAAISARHRVGMVDETFGIVSDWGLGFAIDTYITGRHSSTRAFGHGGHQSSAAFCDPEHGVVLAVVCNGMPGPERHHPRMDAIATAAYVDAGIASASDPGRAKPYPTDVTMSARSCRAGPASVRVGRAAGSGSRRDRRVRVPARLRRRPPRRVRPVRRTPGRRRRRRRSNASPVRRPRPRPRPRPGPRACR